MPARPDGGFEGERLPGAYGIFLEVVDRGSMSKAAWNLGLDVSVVSRNIASLERRFGCELFERHSRGVKLNEAGGLVRSFVDNVVSEELSIRQRLKDLGDLKSGSLKIACTSSAIAGPLSDVLTSFSGKYPEIQIEIHRLPNKDIIAAIADSEVDLGVGFNLEKPSGIVTMGHYDDQLAAVVPAKHPIAGYQSASGRDLADYPIGSFEPTSVKGQMFKTLLDDADSIVRPQLVTNSLDALKHFCETGNGIAILCQSSVCHEITNGTLRAVPLKPARPIRQEICARKDVLAKRAVAAFTSELRSDSPFEMA